MAATIVFFFVLLDGGAVDAPSTGGVAVAAVAGRRRRCAARSQARAAALAAVAAPLSALRHCPRRSAVARPDSAPGRPGSAFKHTAQRLLTRESPRTRACVCARAHNGRAAQGHRRMLVRADGTGEEADHANHANPANPRPHATHTARAHAGSRGTSQVTSAALADAIAERYRFGHGARRGPRYVQLTRRVTALLPRRPLASTGSWAARAACAFCCS